MNGMEKITARMEADAARSLKELEEQTERQLAELRQACQVRIEQDRAAAAQRSDQAAQERYERLCSAAEMETRKLTLSAQQEVLKEAYERALAPESADISAGFLLSSRECDVNCSFETLLALSREKTERRAAQLLFAQ